jgi:RimJ/RimL family protein N-acetyltransferase
MTGIRTRRLVLRPWAPGDEEALVRHADNWQIAKNLRDRFPHPYTRECADAWIAMNLEAEGPNLEFAIVLEGEVVGSVGLIPESDIYRTAVEIGYWIAEPFWGRGLAAEAVEAAAAYAFETLPDVRVVQAHLLAGNTASARVLEKSGFTLDGRLRDAATKAGVVTDVLVYSLTRDDAARRRRPDPA